MLRATWDKKGPSLVVSMAGICSHFHVCHTKGQCVTKTTRDKEPVLEILVDIGGCH